MLNIKILKSLILSFISLIIALHVSCGQAQTERVDKTEKADKLDELISTYAEYGKFNGSVLVAQKGEILLKKGYGFANMEWDIPNQPDTKHRIASITKQFTAALIVQLHAEGKLELEAPISTYLPDYPKEKADQITIHHLLTHSSGTPDYGGFPNYREFERKRHRPEEIVALFSDLALTFKPGERYQYSNSGYVLLGLIIEKTTGKRYAEVLEEKILQPLQMENSGYDYPWTLLKNRSLGYYKTWGKYRNANYLDMSLPYAAGAMYSTVEDLFLWSQALYGAEFLSPKYRDLLFGSYIPASRGRHYAYGWFIGEKPIGTGNELVQTISHSGGMDGVRTQISRLPADSSVVILLSNTESVSFYEMTAMIYGILYEQEYAFPDKSMAHSLAEVIKEEGIAQAIFFYEKVKDADGYYNNEEEFVIAGYDLLHADQAKEAAAIFQLSIKAFPQSFNVYDSYGEVLMVLGENEEAIKNYKKSLELNPNNENGKKMLQKLGAVN